MPASIGVNLRVTGHCRQGGRKYMEDFFSVAYQQTEDERDLEYAFFGIYDGHGGSDAAAFAKERLMETIVRHKNFWSDNDEEVLRSIKLGYIATHYAMWKEQEKWPRTASGLPSTAGTTASIAFIRRGKIYIGHVGDSGIVLGYQEPGSLEWKAKPLTRDHKPECSVEISRIEKCGGKVVAKSGVPRVVWNRPRIGHKGPVRRSTPIDEIPFLAVARSLGDLWSYNSELDEFVVSPDPDCSVIPIDTSTFRCLIFGTDGLYNMLSSQMAVHIVQQAEKHNEDAALSDSPNKVWLNPSKCLVEKALELWATTKMRADNTSVVTLMLDPPGPPRAQVLRNRKKNYPDSGLQIVTRYQNEMSEGKRPQDDEKVAVSSEQPAATSSWYKKFEGDDSKKQEINKLLETVGVTPSTSINFRNDIDNNFILKPRESTSYDVRLPIKNPRDCLQSKTSSSKNLDHVPKDSATVVASRSSESSFKSHTFKCTETRSRFTSPDTRSSDNVSEICRCDKVSAFKSAEARTLTTKSCDTKHLETRSLSHRTCKARSPFTRSSEPDNANSRVPDSKTTCPELNCQSFHSNCKSNSMVNAGSYTESFNCTSSTAVNYNTKLWDCCVCNCPYPNINSPSMCASTTEFSPSEVTAYSSNTTKSDENIQIHEISSSSNEILETEEVSETETLLEKRIFRNRSAKQEKTVEVRNFKNRRLAAGELKEKKSHNKDVKVHDGSKTLEMSKNLMRIGHNRPHEEVNNLLVGTKKMRLGRKRPLEESNNLHVRTKRNEPANQAAKVSRSSSGDTNVADARRATSSIGSLRLRRALVESPLMSRRSSSKCVALEKTFPVTLDKSPVRTSLRKDKKEWGKSNIAQKLKQKVTGKLIQKKIRLNNVASLRKAPINRSVRGESNTEPNRIKSVPLEGCGGSGLHTRRSFADQNDVTFGPNSKIKKGACNKMAVENCKIADKENCVASVKRLSHIPNGKVQPGRSADRVNDCDSKKLVSDCRTRSFSKSPSNGMPLNAQKANGNLTTRAESRSALKKAVSDGGPHSSKRTVVKSLRPDRKNGSATKDLALKVRYLHKLRKRVTSKNKKK